MIRALIVDDEAPARSRLRRLLEAHADIQVVGEAASGDEALSRTLALRPQVVFMDVRMPGPSGTDVASALGTYLPEGVRPAVVFTTAHAEHAVQAFALAGVDYLLKPIERDRLAEALRRVRKAVWGTAPAPAPAEARPAVLEGHHGAAVSAVAVGAIRWVETEDGVSFAHTVDGARTRLGEALTDLETLLPCPPFVRVSRSAILHLERVVKLHPRESGTWEAEMEGGERVPVSRRRARRLRELLGLGPEP